MIQVEMPSMKPPKTVYACQACGHQSPKWLGRCPDCGKWNTFAEERGSSTVSHWTREPGDREPPQPISSIASSGSERLVTGIGEFDRVLGGGLVAGSMVLIGGDPGIGKSTLLLQVLDRLSAGNGGGPRAVLYVTGEESPEQVRLRGDRLGTAGRPVYILPETQVERILDEAKKLKPIVLAVDSIQTMYTASFGSSAGSVGQIREATGQLLMFAKKHRIPTFVVGHVTKDGAIAGPKLLEHMVDTVLYFEGDKGHPYRLLRAVKNRFGSTNEIGVFEMKGSGLSEVSNPSELFLAERPAGTVGSVVVSSIEGTRPILVELQALVSPANFGMPRRQAYGVDPNRVGLLLAVLEKRVGLQVSGQDVFVNVVGGIEVVEPAVDLGIMAAVASSLKERPVDPKTMVIGEVGLSGEIRAVSQIEVRLKEAAKMGFSRCVLPKRNLGSSVAESPLELIGVTQVREALGELFR
jgi:DNA repair protein RadA/Sms